MSQKKKQTPLAAGATQIPGSQPGQAILMQPDNHNKKYEALFVEIDTGQIKLPRFQREFVWDKEQSAKLIDSILKGFPIGTFIFWKTKEALRSYKEVGNHLLPETPQGDYAQYILDGQQRITSLYAIRKGIRITKDGKEIDYKDIFINLNYDAERDDQIVVTEKVDGGQYVPVHDVLSKPLGSFYKTLSHDQADQIQTYRNTLTTYDFSTITIKDYPIEVACEVFARINTGGKVLTVFEIMVAKTYHEAHGFDLAERYETLRDGSDEETECLAAAKFETLPASIIMQCVAATTLKAVRSRDILKIKRETFINSWEPMKVALFMAIDFIRSELRVPVSQLLPYPAGRPQWLDGAHATLDAAVAARVRFGRRGHRRRRDACAECRRWQRRRTRRRGFSAWRAIGGASRARLPSSHCCASWRLRPTIGHRTATTMSERARSWTSI